MAAKNPTDPQMYWMSDFLGMSQRQSMDRIPVNQAIFLLNNSNDKPGTWAKRKGTDLLAATQAGKGVFGLIDYSSPSGTNSIHAVRTTDIDVYDHAADTYSQAEAATFTAEEKVSSEQYKNRVYHVSPQDYLNWEIGGATTDVGTGGNEIKGKFLKSAQNTLFVGNVTYRGGAGSVNEPDRVYYSLFDVDNNVPGDQMYNDDETIVTSTRWFTVRKPVRGLIAYGSPAMMYIFTEDECFKFDLGLENRAAGVRKVFSIGLANHRAATICNNWLIWMDSDGRLWAYGGSGQPIPLSWDIEDDSTGRAIMNQIDRAELQDVCAGSIGSKFWFSVGSVTWYDKTLTNTLIKGLISQDLKYVLWGVDTLPVKPSIFANATIGNKRVLVFGAKGVDDVYVMETGTSDNGTAIDWCCRTMFTSLGDTLSSKDPFEIWVQYRPQDVATSYLKLSYAVDGRISYTAISDPDGTPAVTSHGKINMYESDSSEKTDKIKKIAFPRGVTGRTISIEVANSVLTDKVEVKALGIVYTQHPLDLRFSVD
jgi:hypothetical protein